MIFIDTSAIYALADRADPRHRVAKESLSRILASGRSILTHNYVLVESMALIQHRLGAKAAIQFAESASSFDVSWVDAKMHGQAIEQLIASGRRQLSLVDHVSFVFMRSRGIDLAFAFDRDFELAGFGLLEVD